MRASMTQGLVSMGPRCSYTYKYTYIYKYTHIHIIIHICVYVYIYKCEYIYKHTHIYIYIRTSMTPGVFSMRPSRQCPRYIFKFSKVSCIVRDLLQLICQDADFSEFLTETVPALYIQILKSHLYSDVQWSICQDADF